ncbi:hypothetical protein E2C01_033948 [Portunus trituberculatus]|uniref:Uncharacterized protein n=1 Tax=Portunus trituberculatus TaxID=210409 RepID=A0A5B7F5L6_PORTR|nr:hypothetical protein [Portunus trituberculatus]
MSDSKLLDTIDNTYRSVDTAFALHSHNQHSLHVQYIGMRGSDRLWRRWRVTRSNTHTHTHLVHVVADAVSSGVEVLPVQVLIHLAACLQDKQVSILHRRDFLEGVDVGVSLVLVLPCNAHTVHYLLSTDT